MGLFKLKEFYSTLCKLFAAGIGSCAKPVVACLETLAVFLQSLEARVCCTEAIVSSITFAF